MKIVNRENKKLMTIVLKKEGVLTFQIKKNNIMKRK